MWDDWQLLSDSTPLEPHTHTDPHIYRLLKSAACGMEPMWSGLIKQEAYAQLDTCWKMERLDEDKLWASFSSRHIIASHTKDQRFNSQFQYLPSSVVRSGIPGDRNVCLPENTWKQCNNKIVNSEWICSFWISPVLWCLLEFSKYSLDYIITCCV